MSDAVRLLINYARAKRALNIVGHAAPAVLDPYYNDLTTAEKELYLEGLILAGLDHGKDCQCGRCPATKERA